MLGSQMERCAGFSDGALCWALRRGALCWALRWSAVLGSQTGRVVLGSQMERCAGLSDGAQPQVAKGERPRRARCAGLSDGAQPQVAKGERPRRGAREDVRLVPVLASILIDNCLDGLARPHMTQNGHSTP